MGIQKVSDAQIAITIVPRRARWPEPGAANVWTMAHRCVDALHNLVRQVDLDCAEVEQIATILRLPSSAAVLSFPVRR